MPYFRDLSPPREESRDELGLSRGVTLGLRLSETDGDRSAPHLGEGLVSRLAPRPPELYTGGRLTTGGRWTGALSKRGRSATAGGVTRGG